MTIEIDETVRAAMKACLAHARDLIAAAKSVVATGHPNIAYHLATLALEEVGKRELFLMQAIADREAKAPSWPGKHAQDHVKKLFWAMIGPELHSWSFTKEAFENVKNVAGTVHANRLAGLYVDLSEDGLSLPKAAIDAEQCNVLVGLAEARLAIADSMQLPEITSPEEVELLSWFLAATSDPEKRRQVFSGNSLAQLESLKDTKAWVSWLKGAFDEAEKEAAAAAARELERSRNVPASGSKDKWKIRVRILCASHSVRPKVLKAWNEKIDFIKLQAVSGKNDQLLVDFTLRDNVPIEALWYFGWGIARRFVVALNIGTMGFWWWRLPEHINKYYESIVDLENKMEVRLERSPSLKIDWGENRVLTEEELFRVMACFSALPGPGWEEKDNRAYDYYIGGLTFLSLNDVHWQCEIQAFGNFMSSLKAMMENAGAISDIVSFEVSFLQFIDEVFPNLEERLHYTELCRLFEAKELRQVSLKDATFVKAFCDAYFFRTNLRSRMLVDENEH